jgi:hypothetical protein
MARNGRVGRERILGAMVHRGLLERKGEKERRRMEKKKNKKREKKRVKGVED